MLTQERALEIRRACQDLAIGGEPWEDQLASTMTIEEIQRSMLTGNPCPTLLPLKMLSRTTYKIRGWN